MMHIWMLYVTCVPSFIWMTWKQAVFRRKKFARWWQGQGRKLRIDSDAITSIRDESDIDRRLTVSAFIATMAYVSIWTGFTILTEYFHMSNVHTPCMLKDIEKEKACERFEIVFKTLCTRMRTNNEAIRGSNGRLSSSTKQLTTSYGNIHTVRARCPWIWENWSPCIFPMASIILCWCIS